MQSKILSSKAKYKAEFEKKNIVYNDIKEFKGDYEKIDEDLINTISSFFKKNKVDEDLFATIIKWMNTKFREPYQKSLTQQSAPTKEPVKTPTTQQPVVVKTPTIITDNISSTERKNFLNTEDINILSDPNTTEAQINTYFETKVNKRQVDQKVKNLIKAEFDRKILKIKEKKKEEAILNNLVEYNFDYSSEFQMKDIQEIQTFQKKLLDDTAQNAKLSKLNLNYDVFDKFSRLNVDMYPKLISIMLNPETFCKMWYESLQINTPIENPYKIINKLLHTFFIKSYKKVSSGNLVKTFQTQRTDIFNRDTKLFKSLRIQNLLLLKDKLILERESNQYDELNEYRGKVIFSFITNEINKIKEDDNKYIFNYKLLNELQEYYSLISEDIVKYKNASFDSSKPDFESVLELFYYSNQLTKSQAMLEEIDDKFVNGLPFNTSTSTNIKYKNLIESTYMELIGKFAQVLTYVKERNDAPSYNLSGKQNPRYEIILKYEELEENEQGQVIKKIKDIPQAYPIKLKDTPGIKFYDFQIKYFNYPTAIGMKEPDQVYFNPVSWPKDGNGDFIGPPANTNFQIENAERFVKDPKNKNHIEHYYLGKINRYYGSEVTSESISSDPQCGLVLLNKLRSFENIIIVGNGQSGAGKTASLISRTTKGKNYPGLLPCISNQLIRPQAQVHADETQYFEVATVKLINLYLKLDDKLNDISSMKPDHYWPYNIKLFDTDEDGNRKLHDGKPLELDVPEYEFKPNNGQWRCTNEDDQGKYKRGRLLDQIIAEAFEIREEEPTKNNPNSSRSHIIVCVTFTGKRKEASGNIKDDHARIVICDLAGVEDRFTCELSELIILDRNYTTKSNKYKTLNELGNPFTEAERTKMRLKPIQYDNYFCSDKYYTDKLFPNKLLHEKKELVDQVIKFKQHYDIIKGGKDPIKNKLVHAAKDFEKQPINIDIDNNEFNKLLVVSANSIHPNLKESLIVDKYIAYSKPFEPITFKGAPIVEDPSLGINMSLDVEKHDTTCQTMKECCDNTNNQANIQIIEEFMKDFTKLPDGTKEGFTDDDSVYGNFEKIYKGKTNNEIKKIIIEKIKQIIDNGKENLFEKESHIPLVISEQNKQVIDKLNAEYITFEKRIEDDIIKAKSDHDTQTEAAEKKCSDDKLSGGANEQNATSNINNIKEGYKRKKQELNDPLTKDQSTIVLNKRLIAKINSLKPPIESITIDKKETGIRNELYKFFENDQHPKGAKSSTDTTIRFKTKLTQSKKDGMLNDLTEAIDNLNTKNAGPLTEIARLTKLIEEIESNPSSAIQSIKADLDKESDKLLEKTKGDLEKKLNDKLKQLEEAKEKENKQVISKLNPTFKKIQEEYFDQLIRHRHAKGEKNIQTYLSDPNQRNQDIEKVKYLIQQLVRFSQLEFNCLLRRKEGFMINTSLKEMQKFIGSILFDSAKRRFNKVLIENNLLKMNDEIYRYNDYIKYHTRLITHMNNLISHLKFIIDENSKSYRDILKIQENVNNTVKTCKYLKKGILQYFAFVLNIINNDETKYNSYIDLGMILIYICFINTIVSILINDKINFDIILYGLQNLGSRKYLDEYNRIFGSIKSKSEFTSKEDDLIYVKMTEIFSELYNHANKGQRKHKNFEILKTLYDYSIKDLPKNTLFEKIVQIINELFESKITPECKNPSVIFSNQESVKLNSSNPEFTHFFNDLVKIWDVINKHVSANIESFKEEVKKATYSADSHPTPLLYSSPSIDSCVINKNKYDDEYDKFYDFKKNDGALEFLFQIMTSKDSIVKDLPSGKFDYKIKGFGLEIENSTLVIFTVINITPNPTAPTNNPPTPPFININKLKLIYKIASMPDVGENTVDNLLRQNTNIIKKIEDYGTLFINKLLEYEFYRDFVESKFRPILSSFDKIIQNKGKNLKENIIDFIDSNNATTLLGTVDFEKFTKIRDPTQPYFVCDDKNDSLLKQLFDIKKIEDLLTE
jgi:hypothetical protein